MSLDVYLELPGAGIPVRQAIFIRDNGGNREISRAEWDAIYPGREPSVVTISGDSEGSEVYWANITHNLGKMASEAGIYEALWRPEEIAAKKAADLIGILADGLGTLKSNPEKFKAFNPANGWGDYGGLVSFVEKYLTACKENPEALIRVSR